MLLVRILYNYLIRFGTFITFDFTRGMREGTRTTLEFLFHIIWRLWTLRLLVIAIVYIDS